MRILHLVKSFSFGGAENHVRDLANVLDDMGHDVFILAKRGKQNDLLNSGVKFIPVDMSDLMLPFQIMFVAGIIRKNRIEVIHAHQRLPILIGCLAAKMTGIPIVVTVHGKTQYDIRSPLIRKLVDKFIFVRQSTLDEAPGYGVPASKSLFIQNGVTIQKSDRQRDYNSFCYISRIDKRHSQIISAIIRRIILPLYGEFPDIKFNIVGDGESLEEIRAEAEKTNRQLDHTSIIIHGYMPDITEIVRRSGLVLGVGRVAIETLACGVPVLSVNQKYFGGLVSRENYPFFRQNNFVAYGRESPDEDLIAKALKDYFSKPEYWQNEAAYLQDLIAEDFNIVRITSSIANVYMELAEMKGQKDKGFPD